MALHADGVVRRESAVRAVVAQRSGGVCEIFIPGVCLTHATNISHRRARGQGGEWSPSNCMHACGSGTTGCHGWVESHPDDARKLGLRVASYDDPARAKVLMRTAEWPLAWYYLVDDGTLSCAPPG